MAVLATLKVFFLRDTFHNFQNHERIEFKLNVSLERHLLQFQKIGFILNVSLEKTLSTWQKIQYALKVSLEETLSTI